MEQEQEKKVVEQRSEAEKWDELLSSLIGDTVKVRMRIEYDPQAATVQGVLTQHLSGAWRVHMPSARVQDPRNPQGAPVDVPAQDCYFMSEAVALVVAMPKVSVLGQG